MIECRLTVRLTLCLALLGSLLLTLSSSPAGFCEDCDRVYVDPIVKQAQKFTAKAPVAFKNEDEGDTRKLTLTLKMPSQLPKSWTDGWHNFYESARGTALLIGEKASEAGKWMDEAFSKADISSRPAPAYISPAISAASKYCSKNHSTYGQDGRLKTVANR